MPVRQRMPRVLSACSMQLRRGWAAVSRLVGPAARVGAVVLPRGQSEARQLVDVPDLPPGWFAARDGGKGEIYYFNDRTGEVRCGLLVRRGVGGREVAWWSRPVRSAGGEELCVSVWPRVCFSAVAALPSAHTPTACAVHVRCAAVGVAQRVVLQSLRAVAPRQSRQRWTQRRRGRRSCRTMGRCTTGRSRPMRSRGRRLRAGVKPTVAFWRASEVPCAPLCRTLWCACAAACVALQAMRHIPDRDRDFTSLPVRGGRWRCWGDPRHSAASLHGCIGVCFICGGGVGGWGGLRA